MTLFVAWLFETIYKPVKPRVNVVLRVTSAWMRKLSVRRLDCFVVAVFKTINVPPQVFIYEGLYYFLVFSVYFAMSPIHIIKLS